MHGFKSTYRNVKSLMLTRTAVVSPWVRVHCLKYLKNGKEML